MGRDRVGWGCHVVEGQGELGGGGVGPGGVRQGGGGCVGGDRWGSMRRVGAAWVTAWLLVGGGGGKYWKPRRSTEPEDKGAAAKAVRQPIAA